MFIGPWRDRSTLENGDACVKNLEGKAKPKKQNRDCEDTLDKLSAQAIQQRGLRHVRHGKDKILVVRSADSTTWISCARQNKAAFD